MSEELWLPVVGYEGFYIVSNRGNVASIPRLVRTRWGFEQRPGKRLACFIDKTSTGYRYVGLCRSGAVLKIAVHTLVLTAFVGPRPAGADACHGDGNRTNNALGNLRWDSRKSNAQDRIKHGTQARGERSGVAILTSELVQWIRESTQPSLRLAPILGVASSTIRAVRIGQNWGHQQ